MNQEVSGKLWILLFLVRLLYPFQRETLFVQKVTQSLCLFPSYIWCNFSFIFRLTDAERTVFKVFYKVTSEFQSLKFDGETRIVDEIVRKIKYVMKMRKGTAREDYLAMKERKLSRRRSHPSFHF